MSILQELDKWKLEAKFEESDRYFYRTDDLSEVENGEKCYVIGRKGSGKTAISEYLLKKREFNVFTDKLSFKNYPFNDLYDKDNKSYTRPNQYITLWKYLIYSTICHMMVRNEALDGEVRDVLSKAFGGGRPISNLRREIRQWIGKDFEIKILGIGGKVSLNNDAPSKQSWIDRVDTLEDILIEYLDDSSYFVLFDELDEDYKDIVDRGLQSDYIALLTSLFKAIQDVKSVFMGEKINVFPIAFLRDDIYELILDADKNKWNDFRVDLEWSVPKIKGLIAHRLTKANDPNAASMSFQDSWDLVFSKKKVGVGTKARRMIPIFDYITRSTQLRPRDYIRYIQVAAHESLLMGQAEITPEVVKKVDKGFSNYLRDELVDEIHGALPDIQEVFSIISEIRKQVLSIDEFRRAYARRLKSGSVATTDADFVLKILFHFSVIGNHHKQGADFFRYANREARFNFNENIVVHRGLFKALQII